MGGIARLAVQMGHQVTGSDMNVYPPMSTQLQQLGIEVIEGYDSAQLDCHPDCIVVGNVMTRGHEVIEVLLEKKIPMFSGPQWIKENVLQDRWVLAVAGTHGKTTTTSMLAHILDYAGLEPGFLIGGIPLNFEQSARLGQSPFFVIEADEYDSAFFDKRSKFIHYQPRTVILNNLEFDHADIFRDLTDIKRQFHHLLKLIPQTGKCIFNDDDQNLIDLLAMGCWCERESFGEQNGSDWQVQSTIGSTGFNILPIGGQPMHCEMNQLGRHNASNAMAAMAAARHAGVSLEISIEAMSQFAGVKRRLEYKGCYQGITIYDDFAHHPTEIECTLEAVCDHFPDKRIVVIFEPRSNTMQMGVHADSLNHALSRASKSFVYDCGDLDWSLSTALNNVECIIQENIDDLITHVIAYLREDDVVLILSNGGFEGLCFKLIETLQQFSK